MLKLSPDAQFLGLVRRFCLGLFHILNQGPKSIAQSCLQNCKNATTIIPLLTGGRVDLPSGFEIKPSLTWPSGIERYLYLFTNNSYSSYSQRSRSSRRFILGLTFSVEFAPFTQHPAPKGKHLLDVMRHGKLKVLMFAQIRHLQQVAQRCLLGN